MTLMLTSPATQSFRDLGTVTPYVEVSGRL
jgi:hypothetical protein